MTIEIYTTQRVVNDNTWGINAKIGDAIYKAPFGSLTLTEVENMKENGISFIIIGHITDYKRILED